MTSKSVLVVLCLSSAALAAPPAGSSSLVKRGEYLVNFGGCHDCHTPKKMGPNGPELDTARLLSGHPAEVEVSPAPVLQMPWLAVTNVTMTAWAGPWGMSYSANLTADRETGLGTWTEQNFVDTLRTGRHMGRGRPVLPPMPWQFIGKLDDADLKAIFAYLRTLPVVKNRVPDPVAPAAATTAGAVPPAAGR